MPDTASSDHGIANATACATLIDEWVRWGVTDAVVCPGSRSTPMAVALAADACIRVHVHHDERSGSFMALGLGRVTGRPAIVLVTSGTAAVQLHAAVVEADLDHVPMLVLTADRPPRLRGVGAPQTIDQVGLYGDVVRSAIDAPLPTTVAPSAWRGIARSAFDAAVGSDPGPVHLNLPFDEPLLGVPDPLPPAGSDPSEGPVVVEPLVDPDAIPVTAHGVVIAGSGIDDPDAVLAFATARGWPVLADPRSGCRRPDPVVIAHADALVRSGAPEVAAVVRFGSLPASKVVNRWLGDLRVPHVHVAPWSTIEDPEGVVTTRIVAPASSVAMRPAGGTADPAWLDAWRRADDAAEVAIAALTDDAASEPAIARAVTAAIPSGGHLVVSSSMPVRDVEWFAAARDGLTVHSNRGANGIDGVVSTAVGVALGGDPTALLIGDVAFLHDTNGLLGLDRRGVDLCLVVVDNDGGGIFSFLPQAGALDHSRFEQLFGTPHGVDIATLVHAHGLPVLTAGDAASVAIAVEAALTAGGVHVVLVRTDRDRNVVDHDALHAATDAAVRSAGWPQV